MTDSLQLKFYSMSLMLIVIITIVYNSYHDASLSGIRLRIFRVKFLIFFNSPYWPKVQIKCFFTIYSILVLFSPDKQKHYFPRRYGSSEQNSHSYIRTKHYKIALNILNTILDNHRYKKILYDIFFMW